MTKERQDMVGGRVKLAHRYLIRRNSDRRIVGSTDDLGATLPSGFCLIDTVGEDGLGAGIARYLSSPHPLSGEQGK